MREFQVRTSHRPRPLPGARWVMAQRWNDLLYAHWPVPAPLLSGLIPGGLQIDTWQGSAWLGVLPFWMDRIKFRGLPRIPGARRAPELNLRTYVRDPQTGAPGLYFLSVDASSLVSVAFARTLYRLPSHWADVRIEQRSEREFYFASRRHFTAMPTIFAVRYRGLGPTRRLAEHRPGSLEHFLLERYCLFTADHDGHPMRADIHHVPAPLEEAEADIERNDLASAMGIRLSGEPPVLHYSRRLAVYAWQLQRLRPLRAGQRIPAAAVPSV